MKTINDYKIWKNPNKSDIKILKKESLEKGKWLNSQMVTYEQDGNEKQWEMITRETTNGVVAVLPITKENNIILIEEVRIPMITETYDGRMIGIPAGLVDDGETSKEAIKRELEEETGFTSEDIHYVDSVASSEGMTNEELDVFIAFNCERVIELLSHEEGENINTIYSIPYKEIDDFMHLAKVDGMKKGGKIDCALRQLERKFKDRI